MVWQEGIFKAWFGKKGYLKDGSQGLSKHAPMAQAEHTGLPAGSGTAGRRDFQIGSVKTVWD